MHDGMSNVLWWQEVSKGSADEGPSSTVSANNHPQANKLSQAGPTDNSAIEHLLKEFYQRNNHDLHGNVVQRCASLTDDILSSVLVAARLAVSSTSSTGHNIAAATQLPRDIAALQRQLSKAVAATGPNQIRDLKQVTDCLLSLCKQQQGQWPAAATAVDYRVPSADVLVNMVNIILFSQVTLDAVTTLHSRYEQCSNALASTGLQISSLSACVQAAGKATIAYLMLGNKAQTGELKVPLVVRRNTAFWDALQQLQQQGILPPVEGQQQAPGKLQLAKLFPRFVDESLGPQQGQSLQQGAPELSSANQRFGSGNTVSGAVAVEGGEGHGPRKEFFGLVGENWTKTVGQVQPALFVHLRAAGTWWFNTVLQRTQQLEAAYWTVGWLLGQAIVNRSTVGLQLAPLLFHRLLQPDSGFQGSWAMLEQHDTDAAQGLAAVLSLPQLQYQELLQVEGHPSNTSRQAYVDQAVQQLLVHDVEWQYQALRQGFYTVMDRQVLLACCFDGHSLAAAICGPAADTAESDFDVRQAFSVLVDDEEGSSSHQPTAMNALGQPSESIATQGTALGASTVELTVLCLWQVLDSWSPQQKRAFVKFVTGTDRLPVTGSERLTLSFPFVAYGIKQHQQLLGTLPQSHTCANTLELPNYAEALILTDTQLAQEWKDAVELLTARRSSSSSRQATLLQTCPILLDRCGKLLEKKLLMAVTSCHCYGLDEASSISVPAGVTAPVAATVQSSPVKAIQVNGQREGRSSFLPSLQHPADSGPGASTAMVHRASAAWATVSSSSYGANPQKSTKSVWAEERDLVEAIPGGRIPNALTQLEDGRSLNGREAISTNSNQQQQSAAAFQQQQQHRAPEAAMAVKQQAVVPKLLTESDEEFLDEVLQDGMLRL